MPDTTLAPAKSPCGSCPYRRDVPSGVWVREEYEKLPQYDGETGTQPFAAFLCHQQDGRLCAGWVGCHDMTQSMGLRMSVHTGSISLDTFDETLDYVSPVPLWPSGQAAHDHGVADLDNPSDRAVRIIDRVGNKLRSGAPNRVEVGDE